MFPIKRVTPGFWEDIVTMKWMITPCWYPFFFCQFNLSHSSSHPSIFIQNARSPFGIVCHVGTDPTTTRQPLVSFDIRVKSCARYSRRLSCICQKLLGWYQTPSPNSRVSIFHLRVFLTAHTGYTLCRILYHCLLLHSTIVDNLRTQAHCASLWYS